MFAMNDFFFDVQQGFALFLSTFGVIRCNKLVRIRFRDQFLVLMVQLTKKKIKKKNAHFLWLLLQAAHLYCAFMFLPVCLLWKLVHGTALVDSLWFIFGGSSFLGTTLRTVAFPITLRICSPHFGDQLFFEILKQRRAKLATELLAAPAVSVWTWLPVFLARNIPGLLLALALGLLSLLPLFGTLLAGVAKFVFLAREFPPLVAAGAALLVMASGSTGLFVFSAFVGTRTVARTLADNFLLRKLAILQAVAEQTDRVKDMRKYSKAMKLRKKLLREQLPFLLGFSAVYYCLLTLLPFGAVRATNSHPTQCN